VHILSHGQIRSVNRKDYWTGFFSSMNQHKKLIKATFDKTVTSSNLYGLSWIDSCHLSNQTCTDELSEHFNSFILNLSFDASIGAHHDSITGTSNQEVHDMERASFEQSANNIDMTNRAMLKH
jgi:hypothetical protein